MNLLAAKIYYDGSNWIAIPRTERPHRRKRRRKKPQKNEKVKQFEKAFTQSKGKRKNRKAKLLQEFAPMFKDEAEAEQFVEEHFNRLSRNRWERYKRMNGAAIPTDGISFALIHSILESIRKKLSDNRL